MVLHDCFEALKYNFTKITEARSGSAKITAELNMPLIQPAGIRGCTDTMKMQTVLRKSI